jgi:predicted ester cyclase
MATERAELEAFYRRYLQRCNEHRFDELDEFVDEHVEVNGVVQGLHGTPRDWARSLRQSRTTTGTCGACWSTAAG